MGLNCVRPCVTSYDEYRKSDSRDTSPIKYCGMLFKAQFAKPAVPRGYHHTLCSIARNTISVSCITVITNFIKFCVRRPLVALSLELKPFWQLTIRSVGSLALGSNSPKSDELQELSIRFC